MSLQLKLDITDVNGLQSLLDNKQDKGISNPSGVYSLPIASSSILGGIKIGTGFNFNSSTGILSVPSVDTSTFVNKSSIFGTDGKILPTLYNTGTSSSGLSEGQLIILNEQSWWKIIQPNSYGTAYSDNSKQGKWYIGGYRTNTGVNFHTQDRPDVVFTVAAYNISLPNGGREFSNEAAWDISVETHYDNSGFTPYGDFEAHLFRTYSTDGVEHRYHSVYANKTNGKARQDFEADTLTFMYTRPGQNPFTYGYLQEASLDLYQGQVGRKAGFTATDFSGVVTGMWNIGGEGFLKVPGVIDARGNGHSKYILPNNISGLVAGENYYKTITVNGETFDVITRK